VHKVSIIPRGRAGGYTLMLPKEDRYYATKSELLDQLKTFLGGRVAEAVVLGEISTGAQNDLERCTELVRKMICEFGMSDVLGPITFGKRQEQVFLGRDISRDRNYSEEVAYSIDKEVRRLIEDAYAKTEDMLKANIDKLHLIAKALIEHETLEGAQLDELLKTGTLSDKSKPSEGEPPAEVKAEQPTDDSSPKVVYNYTKE
jgi:cell division protease FtsH